MVTVYGILMMKLAIQRKRGNGQTLEGFNVVRRKLPLAKHVFVCLLTIARS